MFDNVYKNKKVLITGNTGFKGSWLTCWLLKLGAEIYGYSKDIPSNPSMFEILELRNKINHFEEDITDLSSLKAAINQIKPDFIFHLAAQSLVSVSYSNPVETVLTNVIGTTNILESLRTLEHPCIGIIITSDKCYNNVEWTWGYKETDEIGGKDIYSGSKGAAELIFKSYFHSFLKLDDLNIKVASTRAGNVIGGGDWALDRIIPDCMRSWSQNKIVEIRSPESTRPWQHVLEPLCGYLVLGQYLTLNKLKNGESFNFGPISNYNHTVIDLLKDLSKVWKIGLRSSLFKITDNIKFHEASLLKLNCDKALSELKWLPTLEYKDTVKYTGEWYFKYYQKETDMYNFTIDQIKDYKSKALKKDFEWVT